ncbi:acyl-CoA dehydrogenase family protein [Aquisalimonas sp.]|uniref:acyl-CoA dehydrogenase family protein n=1 Tax=unclassified Aquisalimonas TaxID=2644645 RepID=UPI0025BE722E|nr:acyl-CoA dehydrogenase family protein [Aquisalimonas sp.]
MGMPRTIFTPEHVQFRDVASRFMRERIGPRAAAWREQGHVDRDAFQALGEQGFLLMWAEDDYGGAGVRDIRYDQILQEETIRHGEIGFFHNAHSMLVGPYLDRYATPEQKQRFIPPAVRGDAILAIAMTEPGTGSDLAAIRTRAEDRGDHWLLNGAKTYISNGILADLVVVAARTDPDSRHGISLFVVERGMPGFERGRRLQKMGLHAQDTAELFFDDVRLPKENLLGEVGRGFRHMAECLAVERLMSAITSIAHAQVAFDITLEYIKERRAFGRPIGTFQNSRFVMADLRARLDAVQALVDQCVMLANDQALDAEAASGAKLAASELEGEVLDACVQLHGGAGYMEEYRICRMYTDARISRVYAGTSEIMKEIIGRGLGLDERRSG